MGIWHDIKLGWICLKRFRWVWMKHFGLVGPSKAFSKSIEDVTNAKRWNLKLAKQFRHPLVGLNPLLQIGPDLGRWICPALTHFLGLGGPKRDVKMEPTKTYKNREWLVLYIPVCWLGTQPLWFCFAIHSEHVRACWNRPALYSLYRQLTRLTKGLLKDVLLFYIWDVQFFLQKMLWYSKLSQDWLWFYCLLSGTSISLGQSRARLRHHWQLHLD